MFGVRKLARGAARCWDLCAHCTAPIRVVAQPLVCQPPPLGGADTTTQRAARLAHTTADDISATTQKRAGGARHTRRCTGHPGCPSAPDRREPHQRRARGVRLPRGGLARTNPSAAQPHRRPRRPTARCDRTFVFWVRNLLRGLCVLRRRAHAAGRATILSDRQGICPTAANPAPPPTEGTTAAAMCEIEGVMR